jgi:hypothetical protein
MFSLVSKRISAFSLCSDSAVIALVPKTVLKNNCPLVKLKHSDSRATSRLESRPVERLSMLSLWHAHCRSTGANAARIQMLYLATYHAICELIDARFSADSQ